MLHGHPISTSLPEDPTFSERFWYWRGHSGRDYIHSIYRKESCPPLSEAVVVLVRGTGGSRQALGVGRIDGACQCPAASLSGWSEADEIHVHLLARGAERADAIQRDLTRALSGEQPMAYDSGFAEASQLELALPA